MKIKDGPMVLEITGILTEKDVQEEYDKLATLLKGRKITPALQNYIFDELSRALTNKIEITSTRLY